MASPSILLTGANRGIGLELTGQFARDGWGVLASCRNPGNAGRPKAVTQLSSFIGSKVPKAEARNIVISGNLRPVSDAQLFFTTNI